MTPAVSEYEPLVRQMAGRVMRGVPPGLLESADIAQAGRLGLVEAACRWSAATGVPFEAYARLRVRGAMVDAIRKASGRQLERPRLCLLSELTGFDTPAPLTSVERQIDGRHALACARRLPRRERLAVLHYAWHVPIDETAAALGLRTSRVYGLRAAGVERIRAQFGVRH
jgi:RNA polymerase sigma factor (sigma-70 family)